MGVDSVKIFCYNEPIFDDNGNLIGNELITVSDEDIRRDYYPWWKEQMKRSGRNPDDYTFYDCLDDWMVVNWAWESHDGD
jgi:hypothetical protein